MQYGCLFQGVDLDFLHVPLPSQTVIPTHKTLGFFQSTLFVSSYTGDWFSDLFDASSIDQAKRWKLIRQIGRILTIKVGMGIKEGYTLQSVWPEPLPRAMFPGYNTPK